MHHSFCIGQRTWNDKEKRNDYDDVFAASSGAGAKEEWETARIYEEERRGKVHFWKINWNSNIRALKIAANRNKICFIGMDVL